MRVKKIYEFNFGPWSRASNKRMNICIDKAMERFGGGFEVTNSKDNERIFDGFFAIRKRWAGRRYYFCIIEEVFPNYDYDIVKRESIFLDLFGFEKKLNEVENKRALMKQVKKEFSEWKVL